MASIRLNLFAAALLTAAASNAFAQVSTTTGAIVGTVTDNTKAVVPGVTVTVSGPALMGTRTVTTDAVGAYRIPLLPPGNGYALAFELPGFSTVKRENITIGVGFTATINVEMGVSNVQE